ncbi:MAG: single-stranded DNA-binding protein [Chlamydiota bacterium]
MNQILIAGFLGADPEVRFTSSGQKVTSLRVASTTKRGGKEETTWWRVTVWGEQFDKMIAFFKKGSAIMVSGEMFKSEFVDREGKTQVTLNVTADRLMFSPFGRPEQKNDDRASGSNYGVSPFADAAAFSGPASGKKDMNDFNDEDMPF